MAHEPAAGPDCSLHELVHAINAELDAAVDPQPRADDGDEISRVSLGRHICVELAGVQLAIPLASVLEAGQIEILEPLPLLSPWFSGITNIRGNIISVVDLGKFLGADAPSAGTPRSFLIVHNDEIKIAMTVNRIIRTRVLYRSKVQQRQDAVSPFPMDSFFSGQGSYDRDGREEQVPVFDLDGFLASARLHDPVAGVA